MLALLNSPCLTDVKYGLPINLPVAQGCSGQVQIMPAILQADLRGQLFCGNQRDKCCQVY